MPDIIESHFRALTNDNVYVLSGVGFFNQKVPKHDILKPYPDDLSGNTETKSNYFSLKFKSTTVRS